MPSDDVVRLDLVGLVDGQNVIVTHHFRYLTGAASETDLINDWIAACKIDWLQIFSAAYTLVQIEALQVWPGPLDNQRGPTIVNQGNTGTGGAVYTGERLASWLAEDIRVFTTGRGRSRHGRFFLWVPTEDCVSGNNLVGTYNTFRSSYLGKLFTNFLSGGSNPDYRMGVYSRKFAYVPNTHPPAFNPSATISQVFREAASFSPAGVLTTQRSRRPKL